MTQPVGGRVFSGLRQAMLIAAGMGAMASGCTTPIPDDAALAAAAPKSASQVRLADNAQNTGTFPNLNIPPEVAAEQLTPEERTAKLGEIKAKQSGQAAKGAGAKVADPALLKKLGTTHVKDTLKQIEQN
jgi:hypothetical protein